MPVPLAFATSVDGFASARRAALLVASVRAHAGRHAGAPVIACVAADRRGSLAEERAALERSGATPLPVARNRATAGWPFATKTHAAGHAEGHLAGEAALLAWLDVESIVTGDATPLALAPGAAPGCRPVDHLLIGPRADRPPDAPWAHAYAACGADPDATRR